jgi:predicted Zn-dependent peptidase
LVKKGVSPRELKDAKTHIRGALTLSLEDSSAQASWYAKEALFMKKIENPGERLKEIEKVTNAQIKALAKKVFDWRKVRVAIIGDVKREAISF